VYEHDGIPPKPKLKHLETLYLTHNDLNQLPDEISNLRTLTQLWLNANCLVGTNTATHLQHTFNTPATHLQYNCNTTALHCIIPYPTLQHTCNTPATHLQHTCSTTATQLHYIALYCITLQYSATTLQHTALHYNTLQHTAAQFTWQLSPNCGSMQTVVLVQSLQHTVLHCNTM